MGRADRPVNASTYQEAGACFRKEANMHAARRRLAIGLMAATLVTTSLGLLPERAHAKPIDEGYAQKCLSISRRVAEIAEEYNDPLASPDGLGSPALLAEYRELLRQWYANGCDSTFGSLPRLNSRPIPAGQVGSPGSQVLAPANAP
jgi:hypothetical protein